MIELRRFAPALLAAFLIAAVGCTDTPPDPATLIAKAREYRSNRKYSSAIIELRNALAQNPDNAEARYLLGTTYLDNGDVAFATVELQKAQALGYDPKQVLPDLAKSLILQDKFKEALDATDPSKVASAQGSPEILNIRSLAQLALRQLAAAKASLDLAMILRPDFADGMLSQARIAILEGKTDEAKGLVDKALSIAPKNIDGWMLKANLQRHEDDVTAARTSLRKAIEIDPRSVAPKLDLASLEIAAGHYDDASQQLEAVRTIAPRNVTGVYLKALLEMRTGNTKAALESVYRALEIAPKHVPSTLLGGMAELALGHREQAEKYLSAAIDLDPRNVYGRKMLATSQMQRGQYAQAVSTLEPILDPKVPAKDPAVLALAAEAYMQNRQFTKATEYFEQASTLDPQNPRTRINLGMSRMAEGATDRAVADLEAAAALGAGGARADIILATMSIKRGEFDKALRIIAKLEKSSPDNALLLNMKAGAYLGKGDKAQARSLLERAVKSDPTYLAAATNLAQLDLQRGDVAAARSRYEGVLQKDSNQVEAMLALADLISRTGGPEKDVLQWTQRAKTVAPDASAPFRVEIEHYRRTGQLQKALAIAVEQRRLRPNDPDALAILGQLLLASGHTKEALAVFADRTVLAPGSAEALYDLASVQMVAKDSASASATLQRALRIAPSYPAARALLVSAELAQDRAVRALQIAREVQHDLPKSPLGYVLEGDVLVATKKPAQAAAMYERAYALRKSGPVAIKIHDAWIDAGKPDQAEAKLTEWLAQNPNDVEVRYRLAMSRIQREKYALAVEQFRIVLQRRPKDPVVLNNMAFAMGKMKDPASLGVAQQAHELRPGDGGIADTFGQALVDSGDLPRGVAVLEKAVTAAPSNREIRYHFAQALAKSGDKAKAISQLEIVIGSGPKFAQEAEAIALLKQLRQ